MNYKNLYLFISSFKNTTVQGFSLVIFNLHFCRFSVLNNSTNGTNATWIILGSGFNLSTRDSSSRLCYFIYTPGDIGKVVKRIVTKAPISPFTAAEVEHTIIVRTVPVIGHV
jgi:hypothetical protein